MRPWPALLIPRKARETQTILLAKTMDAASKSIEACLCDSWQWPWPCGPVRIGSLETSCSCKQHAVPRCQRSQSQQKALEGLRRDGTEGCRAGADPLDDLSYRLDLYHPPRLQRHPPPLPAQREDLPVLESPPPLPIRDWTKRPGTPKCLIDGHGLAVVQAKVQPQRRRPLRPCPSPFQAHALLGQESLHSGISSHFEVPLSADLRLLGDLVLARRRVLRALANPAALNTAFCVTTHNRKSLPGREELESFFGVLLGLKAQLDALTRLSSNRSSGYL